MFISLPIHLIIIAIFFAFRYGTQKINEYSRSKMLPIQSMPKYIMIPILMFIMFIVQGFSNRQQLMQKCNIDMSQTAFMTSAITIFLIFGSIVSLIESIPLLKSPFDNTGLINFIAENDASEQTTYGSILMQLEDVSNGSEDASFYIQTINKPILI